MFKNLLNWLFPKSEEQTETENLSSDPGDIQKLLAETEAFIAEQKSGEIDLLIKDLDSDDPEKQLFAINAIGRLGTKGIKALSPIIDYSVSEQTEIRRAANTALDALPTQLDHSVVANKKIPFLIKKLQNDNLAVVISASRILTLIGERAVQQLLDAFSDDQNVDIQREALKIFKSFIANHYKIVEICCELISNSPHPTLIVGALDTLNAYPSSDPLIEKNIVHVLLHQNQDIKLKAIQLVHDKEISAPQVHEILINNLGEKDAPLQKLSYETLVLLGSKMVPQLIAILDPEVILAKENTTAIKDKLDFLTKSSSVGRYIYYQDAKNNYEWYLEDFAKKLLEPYLMITSGMEILGKIKTSNKAVTPFLMKYIQSENKDVQHLAIQTLGILGQDCEGLKEALLPHLESSRTKIKEATEWTLKQLYRNE